MQSGLGIRSCPHLLRAELLPQWNLCSLKQQQVALWSPLHTEVICWTFISFPPHQTSKIPGFQVTSYSERRFSLSHSLLSSVWLAPSPYQPIRLGLDAFLMPCALHLFFMGFAFPPLPKIKHSHRQRGPKPEQPN